MKKQTSIQTMTWSVNDNPLKSIASLYQQVWNMDADCTEHFKRHMSYEGFRGSISLNEDNELIGFSYGYASLPGQYYHELLAKHLPPVLRDRWLANCFEFVELCVHPSSRQQGFGAQLHDHLLENMQYETAVLTTQKSNLSARKLYEKKGWKIVDDSFYPNKETNEQYLIYAKKLN